MARRLSDFAGFVPTAGKGGKFRHKATALAGTTVVLLLALVLRAWAEPLLHEHFVPDPSEDMRLGATVSNGSMPAWVRTKSGWVSAPDPIDRPAGSPVDASEQTVYGGTQTESQDSAFVLDRLTTRPSRVDYDEPFRPSIVPYKRLYAFDGIGRDFSLSVVDPQLSPVLFVDEALETDDVFFGDFEVDLVQDQPVRIPSVGPETRVLALDVDPKVPVVLLRDGADNWFARGERGGRVRIYAQLSVRRQSFGSQFLPVSRQTLASSVPPVSDEVRAVAQVVLAHIGVTDTMSPAGTLQLLVQYFRGFVESDDLPTARTPLGLYEEMSLSQIGVCRHRAFAFVVTALAWGIPARLVHNEAHAWVEVFDSELWHRVDLGGAASELTPTRMDQLFVRHRPPSDPFGWPAGERAASVEFDRSVSVDSDDSAARRNGGANATDQTSASDAGWVDAFRSSRAPSSSDDSLANFDSTEMPASLAIDLRVDGNTYLRGTPVKVEGEAKNGDDPCVLSRVDVQVILPSGPRIIGSLATDREGHFRGQVTLPATLPVGPQRLAATLGNGCRLPKD